MTHKADMILGAGATIVGSSGLSLQFIVEYSNVLLTFLNLGLTVGGIVLLTLRLRVVRTEHRLLQDEHELVKRKLQENADGTHSD